MANVDFFEVSQEHYSNTLTGSTPGRVCVECVCVLNVCRLFGRLSAQEVDGKIAWCVRATDTHESKECKAVVFFCFFLLLKMNGYCNVFRGTRVTFCERVCMCVCLCVYVTREEKAF